MCIYLVLCNFITHKFVWSPSQSKYKTAPLQGSLCYSFIVKAISLPCLLLKPWLPLNCSGSLSFCHFKDVIEMRSYSMWSFDIGFFHSAQFPWDPLKLSVSVVHFILLCLIFHGMDYCSLLNCLLIEGHLYCFLFSTITNKIAKNTHI